MSFPWASAFLGQGVFGDAASAFEANRQNRRYTREANDLSRAMSREQMSFQERMSNTAYQRARDDMTKAGINPILAYTQGGASSPGGATGAATPGRAEPVKVRDSSSALDSLRLKGELRNLEASNANMLAQANLSATSARKVQAETDILNSTRGLGKFKSSVAGDAHSAYSSVMKNKDTLGSIFGGSIYSLLHPKKRPHVSRTPNYIFKDKD